MAAIAIKCFQLIVLVVIVIHVGEIQAKKFLLVTNRWNEEFQSITLALQYKGHEVDLFHRFNKTELMVVETKTSQDYDLVVYDRRYPILKIHKPFNNVIWLDTDLILDSDNPLLSIPAPLSRYGCPEEEYKESTFRRVENALNRLRFHLSSFSQQRRDHLKQRITISTSSFLLDATRPIPPWFMMAGRIARQRKSNKKVIGIKSPGEATYLVLVLASEFNEQTLRNVVEMVERNSPKKVLMIVTTIPVEYVDPTGGLRNLFNLFWIDDVSNLGMLSRYITNHLVLTSGDLSAVYSILSLGGVPAIVSKGDDDFYARELSTVLKRRNLGVGLFEEWGQRGIIEAVPLLQVCRNQVRNAQQALEAPSEMNGLYRTVEILEALASNPIGLQSILKIDIPVWYQYWFLDIYLVYGLVMASVFVLMGSLTSGASSLLL
jgi:hypothetical protein